jgi:hypothetical protein
MSNRIGDHYNRYSEINYTESNSNQFNQNDYNNVYNKDYNVKYSLQQDSDIEYEEYVHYVTISSKDRDRSVFPNVNNYCITLPQEFRNVSSVELVQAIIPAQNDADAEPYLLLDIDEISEVMISTDRHISDSFAILQPSPPTTAGGFMQIDKRIHENTVKYYKTPKASISKLTVSIRDSSGALFNFGNDASPPSAFTKALQNTFVFKLTILEKRRKDLHHRNVF